MQRKRPAVRRRARARAEPPVGLPLLVAASLGLIVLSVWLPRLGPYFATAWFQNTLRGIIAAGALAALAATLASLRRRPAPKLLALAVLVPLTVYAFRTGTNLKDPQGRLREQIHFVEYGALAVLGALVFRRRRPDGSAYLLGLNYVLWVGLADEAAQWWVPGRVGVLEDVRMDLVAGLLGTGFAASVLLPERVTWRLTREGLGSVLLASAVSILAFTAFLDLTMLGHRVEVAEAGVRLRSQMSRKQLEGMATRWAPRAPATWLQGVWRGKDRYHEEASWHNQRRNEFLEANHRVWALEQQVILEHAYGAYLAAFPDRDLAPELRAELGAYAEQARAAGRDAGPPHLLVGLDRAVLWLGAILLATLAALGGEWLCLRRLSAPGGG